MSIAMPRLTPRIYHQQLRRHPWAAPMALVCGGYAAARQEYAWIQQELPRHAWAVAARARARGVPLQYLLGSQPFAGVEIGCEPGVLIPRSETEAWVVELARCLALRSRVRVWDLCTGSGCVALGVGRQVETANRDAVVEAVGVDKSVVCVELAERNRRANGMERVGFVEDDVLDPGLAARLLVDGAPTVITCNPPYVPELEYHDVLGGVAPLVRLYEPQTALVGDTEFYHALVRTTVAAQPEAFVFEIGLRLQAEYTASLLQGTESGWQCGVWVDGNGKDRCVIGWRPPGERVSSMCSYRLGE